jgi:ABC-2 type transport system ATP-binding protein
MNALEIRNLTKRFTRPAVESLDLTVRAGEFYALLGPNGAGKTTTLRMVAGLLRPDNGSISIFGTDALREPLAAKKIMAWVPDEPMIYDRLTPLEYLEFVAGLWSIDRTAAMDRAERLLAWLQLADHANERCEGFSKGMRQKVALAGALVHDPRLIILDEPLTGLDASSARLVKNVLIERVREVLLPTRGEKYVLVGENDQVAAGLLEATAVQVAEVARETILGVVEKDPFVPLPGS